MTLAWFDCSAGAAGDMLLAALLDAGAPLDAVQAAVDALGVEPIRVATRRTARHGLAATAVTVEAAGAPGTGTARGWRDVRALLEKADLAEPVRGRALDAFARLARAEGQVHGVDPEDVHFHEVGALDAIADVVGVSAALHALGIDEIAASAVTLGSGRSRGEHGIVPVPGPAVLALLAEAGAPVEGGPAAQEMCTPTGAALLAAAVTSWGPLPSMRLLRTGVGAGARDLAELPNVVRVVLGERDRGAGPPPPTAALLLEANVDDLDPRLWPAVLARLLDAGADDAWLVPIVMKKGRPAHTLSALVVPERADAVRRVVFTETSTIGVRETGAAKRALERAVHRVDVGGATVRVKTASLDGVVVNAQPEYDDVAAAAAALGRPVKSVLAAAVAAAHAAGLAP